MRGAATARAGRARTPRSPPSPLMHGRAGGRRARGARHRRAPDEDDTLTLLLHCCHPELSAPSQIALTLRAVGGLTTAEIARAFLVPEATMAQRISRAKARIRATGTVFAMGPGAEREERLPTVLHVLYLVFNEGYTASSGPSLARGELTARSDSADARSPAAAARRRRGRGSAGADAPDRRAAGSTHDGRRVAGAAGRAGSGSLERRRDRRGRGADHRRAGPRAARALPGAGRDRRRTRRSGEADGPTGRRSSRSTGCWSGSRPTRW